MPELRKDPISGRWVIISVERGKRPTDFVSPSQKRKLGGFCPFDPGSRRPDRCCSARVATVAAVYRQRPSPPEVA